MQFPLNAKFVDRASGGRVRGLIQIAADQHLLLWTGWRYRPNDEDRSWDWWKIYQDCGLAGGRYECYVALAENELQGLMALDLKQQKTQTGNGIIVDYLATNPVNRTMDGGLKYVGIALMAVALRRSFERGASGRIWLESLPGAIGFYESLGMVRQPQKSTEGNAVYTLEPEATQQLLAEIKEQGIVEI